MQNQSSEFSVLDTIMHTATLACVAMLVGFVAFNPGVLSLAV